MEQLAMQRPPRRILVVDDDADARLVFLDMLESEGYSAEAVSDGLQALKVLNRGELPGLIILDLMMPGVTGLRFLEMRAGNPALAAIPVVVATASGMTHVQHDVLAVLPKPLDVTTLLSLVARTCGPAQMIQG